jgi:protein ImuB
MSRMLKTLPLFPGKPGSPSRVRTASRNARRFPESSSELSGELWIAVHLPQLMLEAQDGASPGNPRVVVEAQQGQLRVAAANEVARAHGIDKGLKLSAALAISNALEVSNRTPEAERASLHSLAIWSRSLTPTISLEPPDGLLLEVRGSLRLFGGIERIKSALALQIERRRLSFRMSVAPSAKGALWLSRLAGHDTFSFDALIRLLRSQPLSVMRWPAEIQTRLVDMGVESIGECLRLPRDGLRLRIGERYLRDLDRAFGRTAELRERFESSETLGWRADLNCETCDLVIMLDAAGGIIERIAHELRKRQMQVRGFRFLFHHIKREPTVTRFDLIAPTHEKSRFLDLLSDRLERITLPAPVIAVQIETDTLVPMCLVNGGLFRGIDPTDQGEESGSLLIERLRERFGTEKVFGIALSDDHRPELAWRSTDVAPGRALDTVTSPLVGARPLWLLSPPYRLPCRDDRPWYGGALEILDEPERIESGWWSGGNMHRDYYPALAVDGRALWVYRDRVTEEWYLHGVFG